MKTERSLSKAKRSAVAVAPIGKTSITMQLDKEIVEWFRTQGNKDGKGSYHSLINAVLYAYIARQASDRTLPRTTGDEKRLASWINLG